MNVFIAAKSDDLLKRLSQSKLIDNVEETKKLSVIIDNGNEIFSSWALRSLGSTIQRSGDEVVIQIGADTLSDLEAIRKQYESTTKSTVSVGIGIKVSEAVKALNAALSKGGNCSLFYEKSMEELSKATPSFSGYAGGEHKENVDATALNTLQTPAAPLTEQNSIDAQNNEAVPTPGQGVGSAVNFEFQPQPIAGSQLHFEEAFKNHANQAADRDRAAQLKQSDDYQQLKGKVAEALMRVKEQMPIINTLRTQAPDTYEAIMGIVRGIILLGRQVSDTDSRIEKMEKIGAETLSPLGGEFGVGFVGAGFGKSEFFFDADLDEKSAKRLQYDGPLEMPGSCQKHSFIYPDDGTKYVFKEVADPSQALASEAVSRLAELVSAIHKQYPIRIHQLVGRSGTMQPAIPTSSNLLNVPPQELTEIETFMVLQEFIVDFLTGNAGTDGSKLLRTVDGFVVGLDKKDAFKDFDNIGSYYRNLLEAVKAGTVTLSPEIIEGLGDFIRILMSVSEDEYLENVGQYAQRVFGNDVQQQVQFCIKLIERKRNLDFLIMSFLKQDVQKGERPEYGKMRGHIKLPVGSLVFGKMKVRHWDGSESWKSIKAGAIRGLDPGAAYEGHPVSAKNPSAK